MLNSISMSFHIGHNDLTEKELLISAAPDTRISMMALHPSQKKEVSVIESPPKIYEANAGSETQSDTSSEDNELFGAEATV